MNFLSMPTPFILSISSEGKKTLKNKNHTQHTGEQSGYHDRVVIK
jgi:hypothetical protein